MNRETLVYVDLDGKPRLVGRLWAHVHKNKESASFEYDKMWLEDPVRFSLEPALQVGPGAFLRRPTRRCSGPSAIRRRTVGGVRSCAELSVGVPSAPAPRPALCRKSTSFYWWMMKPARVRCGSPKRKAGRFCAKRA